MLLARFSVYGLVLLDHKLKIVYELREQTALFFALVEVMLHLTSYV